MAREYAPQELAREPETPKTTGLFPELGTKETAIPKWAQEVAAGQQQTTRQAHYLTSFGGVLGQRKAKAAPKSPLPDRLKAGLEHLAGYSIEQVRELHGRSSAARSVPIQTKLTVGQANDKYEREADQIAAQVVKRINLPAVKGEGQAEQHSELKQQPTSIQAQPLVRPSIDESEEISSNFESEINRARSHGQDLDPDFQVQVGQVMGADFSGVRVHTDARANALNQSLQAKAFTTGQDVFFRQGAYQPESWEGQKLIAHELAHVTQQNGAAVRRSRSQLSQYSQPHHTDTEVSSATIGASEEVIHFWTGGYDRVLQRKLYLGKSKTPVDPEWLKQLIAYVRNGHKKSGVENLNPIKESKLSKDIIYTASKHFARNNSEHQLEILCYLLKQAEKEEDVRFGTTTRQAIDNIHRNLVKKRHRNEESPEKRKEREEQWRKMQESVAVTSSSFIHDDELTEEQWDGFHKAYDSYHGPPSPATDIFDPESEHTPTPIKRRKLHRDNLGKLDTEKVRYRTWEGTISPKSNAFILGEGKPDYGELFRELSKQLEVEAPKASKKLSDKDIAALFLQELEGEDAFGDFSLDVKKSAHKIMALIFFAELSRSSANLISAAATFYAIVNRPEGKEWPKLIESFQTGSGRERPFFAGKGGAEFSRSGTSTEMNVNTIETRKKVGALDLHNFSKAYKDEKESNSNFIKRWTLSVILSLLPNTSSDKLKKPSWLVDNRLYARMCKIRRTKDNPLQTLQDLGFTHHIQGGDENNCAANTLYHQLTTVHKIEISSKSDFTDYIRTKAGFSFGSMIDILNNGVELLEAVRSYLVEKLGFTTAPSLTIDTWAANADDGTVMEFQDVASVTGGDNHLYLTFYFDGINHFDSLTGGLSRAS